MRYSTGIAASLRMLKYALRATSGSNVHSMTGMPRAIGPRALMQLHRVADRAPRHRGQDAGDVAVERVQIGRGVEARR